METVKTPGYILEKEGEKFISISDCLEIEKINLGDTVISNGRIFAAKGAKGTVVRIFEPSTCGLTIDVVAVQWEGREEEGEYLMKFKDFDWEAMRKMRRKMRKT